MAKRMRPRLFHRMGNAESIGALLEIVRCSFDGGRHERRRR